MLLGDLSEGKNHQVITHKLDIEKDVNMWSPENNVLLHFMHAAFLEIGAALPL